MKKNMKLMSMLLGSLLALSSLTACGGSGSDNPEPAPQPVPEKQPASLKVDYTATVSQQLLDVATVTVRYIGDNGQIANEQMTSTTWTKSVTIALPAKAGLNIQPTLKGEVPQGNYTLQAKGELAYNWLDSDGKLLSNSGKANGPAIESVLNHEGVGPYLGAITSNCQIAKQFSKDYNVNNTDITWGGNADGNSTHNTPIDNTGATGDSE